MRKKGDHQQLTLGDMPMTAPYQRRDTSIMAARMVAPHLTKRRVTVLLTLVKAKLTVDEVEQQTGLPHQTCGPRMGELEDYGFVVDTGWRRLTRHGKPAIVWQMTPEGRAALNEYLARPLL
jgi:predicted ArsR family transcriptional regulator